MRRNGVALFVTVVLLGCARNPRGPATPGFINQTLHSDADLQAIWKEAQQSVAQKIDLNPLQRLSNNVPEDARPGDSRAFNVEPNQLSVSPVADLSPEVLLAATGEQHADPTGLIACPQPCNVRYSAAYSFYQPELTRYAAS
ncbi:MAG TPA: hypothetical protein VNW47_01185, partial [Terriglobales bacterium]|nr:hypothetical protein [Terriglobales bacterium]